MNFISLSSLIGKYHLKRISTISKSFNQRFISLSNKNSNFTHNLIDRSNSKKGSLFLSLLTIQKYYSTYSKSPSNNLNKGTEIAVRKNSSSLTSNGGSGVLPLGSTSRSNNWLGALEITKTGEVNPVDIIKSDLALSIGLHSRDLRVIDPSFPDQLPTLLARSQSILVNLSHIRALIQADRIIVFDPYHPEVKRFTSKLAAKFRSRNLSHQPASSLFLPFEFRSLEAVLESVVNSQANHMDLIRPAIEEILDGLTANPNEAHSALKRLLPLTNSLSSFRNTVKETKKSLEEVLNNDEDMTEMYLTSKAEGMPRTIFQHHELELLLESYLKRLEEVYHDVLSLHHSIQSTQQVIKIHLDSVRNTIIRVNLRIALATFCLGTSAFVTSAFGMNLINGLEEHPQAFLVTMASTMSLSAFAFIFLQYKFNKHDRLV